MGLPALVASATQRLGPAAQSRFQTAYEKAIPSDPPARLVDALAKIPLVEAAMVRDGAQKWLRGTLFMDRIDLILAVRGGETQRAALILQAICDKAIAIEKPLIGHAAILAAYDAGMRPIPAKCWQTIWGKPTPCLAQGIAHFGAAARLPMLPPNIAQI